MPRTGDTHTQKVKKKPRGRRRRGREKGAKNMKLRQAEHCDPAWFSQLPQAVAVEHEKRLICWAKSKPNCQAKCPLQSHSARGTCRLGGQTKKKTREKQFPVPNHLGNTSENKILFFATHRQQINKYTYILIYVFFGISSQQRIKSATFVHCHKATESKNT